MSCYFLLPDPKWVRSWDDASLLTGEKLPSYHICCIAIGTWHFKEGSESCWEV